MKPALHLLRLCHRFGKGTEAHITRLPQELFDIIVQYATVIERARLAPHSEWQVSFKCFEGRCDAIDHFSEEFLEELRDQTLADCFEHYSDADALEAHVEDHILDLIYESGEYEDVCLTRKQDWMQMVRQKHSDVKLCISADTSKYGFANFDQVSRSLRVFSFMSWRKQSLYKSTLSTFCIVCLWLFCNY
jgi:hypothetical protein